MGNRIALTALIALLIVVTRFLVIAGALQDTHTVFFEEKQQSLLAQGARCGEQPARLCVREAFRDAASSLPDDTQFHGIMMLNSVLIALVSAFRGFYYANLSFVALGYFLIVYLAWSSIVARYYGHAAFVAVSLLFLLPPTAYLCSSLFLIGSHVEGCALIALMFWFVFGTGRPRLGAYLLAASFGVFFFLYKGVVIAVPGLIAPTLRALDIGRRRLVATLLLIAGFLPMVIFHMRHGFFGHYLEHRLQGADTVTWFNVFARPSFQWSAFGLPPLGLSIPGLPPLPWLIPCLGAMALVLVVQHHALGDSPAKAVTLSILSVPIALWVMLWFSRMEAVPRYFIPLYPIVLVVLAAGLSRLKTPIGAALTVALCVVFALGAASLIRPADWGMQTRYRGVEYFSRGINYVPAESVDAVNDWLDRCPDNRGFGVSFRQTFESRFGVDKPPALAASAAGLAKDFVQTQNPAPQELVALGAGLKSAGARTDDWDAAIAEAGFSPEGVSLVREGFEGDGDPCPGDP